MNVLRPGGNTSQLTSSRVSHIRDDLRCWAELREAARALDAVLDSLPSEEDERARELLVQVERLRFEVETRVARALGIEPRPPYTGN